MTIQSSVRRTISALRADALAGNEGDFLGVEDSLLARYKVSRPTLRQAVRVVIQEQLVRVKRGVGGGYFVSRPDSRSVAHMASIFLKTKHVNAQQVLMASTPLRIEIARRAAFARGGGVVEELLDLKDASRAQDDAGLSYREFLRSERRFWSLLGAAGGNDVLWLFMEIVLDLAGTIESKEDPLIKRPDRVKEMIVRREDLLEAVIKGNIDLAAQIAQRSVVIGSAWVNAGLIGEFHAS